MNLGMYSSEIMGQKCIDYMVLHGSGPKTTEKTTIFALKRPLKLSETITCSLFVIVAVK